MTNKTTLMSGVILGAILITGFSINDASAAMFATYKDLKENIIIEGESGDANHDKWIDILSLDWSSHKKTNKRGTVIVEDMRLTMEFEKSTPKLLEAMNFGKVIPKLEIEQTANFGGSRATYIKYELTNVQVTAFDVNASGNGESPPIVTLSNNFEEYKVTYTEYDGEGNKGGNAETTWKVEKGEK